MTPRGWHFTLCLICLLAVAVGTTALCLTILWRNKYGSILKTTAYDNDQTHFYKTGEEIQANPCTEDKPGLKDHTTIDDETPQSQNDGFKNIVGHATENVSIESPPDENECPSSCTSTCTHYGALSNPPSSKPTELYSEGDDDSVNVFNAGDKYYDTSIQQEMIYDSDRHKWLSAATFTVTHGRRSSTPAGAYYRRADGMSSGPSVGTYVASGTVTEVSWSMSTSAVSVFRIEVNGLSTLDVLTDGDAHGRMYSVNSDFPEGIMSSLNASGDTTQNFQCDITYKLRSPSVNE